MKYPEVIFDLTPKQVDELLPFAERLQKEKGSIVGQPYLGENTGGHELGTMKIVFVPLELSKIIAKAIYDYTKEHDEPAA